MAALEALIERRPAAPAARAGAARSRDGVDVAGARPDRRFDGGGVDPAARADDHDVQQTATGAIMSRVTFDTLLG